MFLVKILHKSSEYFLSITLSCKHFLYTLSEEFLVCCALSSSFFYCFHNYFVKNFSNVNPQEIPFEIGITINPEPVTDNATEVEVVAIITKVSTVLI